MQSNTVRLDGLTATVTSASATQLQITVPTAACKPSREVQLVVKVASDSATATVGMQPASVWDLGLGSGVYTTGGDCFQVSAGSGSEKYAIGIFSSSESATSLTPYTQTLTAGTILAGNAVPNVPIVSDDMGYFEAPIVAAEDQPVFTSTPSQGLSIEQEYDPREIAHTEAEARRWEAWIQSRDEAVVREEIALRDMISAQAAETAPARSVGDTIAIKMLTSSRLCSEYDTISTVVRYVGTSAFYLEDLDNPVDTSFTAAEYATLDATFSGTTWPKLKEYFGSQYTGVFGLDDADRVAVVVTKKVNEGGGALGFVEGTDFRLPSNCAVSNDGELFYGRAPDPDGVYGTAYTQAEVLDIYPALLAHESTHILQFTQTELRTGASKAAWETEGGATMAEWLVGNEIFGHGGAGQNLGLSEFQAGYTWYKDLVNDYYPYFGWSSSGRVAGAPEECTWLARKPPGPCGGGDGNWVRSVYGPPAALLRFILDYYGPSYVGGEAALMRTLTSSAQTGYDNLVTTTGASSIGLLLTLFGLNLYSDGRTGVYQGQWTSAWTYFDFNDLMRHYTDDNTRLQPYTSSAVSGTESHSVRGGSTAYFEWSPPSSHGPTSIRIRTPIGDELPNTMGMWIFRIQ
jgi:hypothetical protein